MHSIIFVNLQSPPYRILCRKDKLWLIAGNCAVAVNSMNFFCAEYRQAQTMGDIDIDHRAKRASVYQYFSTYRAGAFFISCMPPGAGNEWPSV